MVTYAKRMNISMPIEMAEKLKIVSEEEDIPISALVRKGVKELMKKWD